MERSAGGVVLREQHGRFELAVIRPRGRAAVALPKGHIDPGETAQAAAAREVEEETGLKARLVKPLGEVRYSYSHRKRLVHKSVEFFLFDSAAGEIGAISEAMRHEVEAAWWVALDDAPAQLTYPGERDMVRKALEWVGGGR